jgi:hypothetical protein
MTKQVSPNSGNHHHHEILKTSNKIDHIVIGANSLIEGKQVLEPLFGIPLPMGGKHKLVSTHNCVLQSGDDTYLELIATDPDAPAPSRRRWFSLDEDETKKRLAVRPRALTWVVSTPDLDKLVANSPIDLGEILDLNRDDLNWRLTVPRDGSLPEGGLIPSFISWPEGNNPSPNMADHGLRLTHIRITHPDPSSLIAMMEALDIADLAEVSQGEARLSFSLACPNGEVIID